MAIDIVASAGGFEPAVEAEVMAGVYQALLAAVDATNYERCYAELGHRWTWRSDGRRS